MPSVSSRFCTTSQTIAASALGKLLDLYCNYLRLLAGHQLDRRLSVKVDASDMVQETFLDAYQDFATFRGHTEKELVTWLRQILVHNLIDVARRFATASRDVSLEHTMQAQLEESSRNLSYGLRLSDSSPSQKAVRREQAVLLADAIAKLPIDYREVVMLRHMDGLSFPEVANQMDRSVDSVRKSWTRALVQIRQLMGEA